MSEIELLFTNDEALSVNLLLWVNFPDLSVTHQLAVNSLVR
jgi:hypothetical protein